MGFLIASMIAEWLTAAVLVYFGHIKSSFALATLLTVAFGSLLVASGAELFELPANTSVHRALELGVFYGSLGLIFLAATPFGCIYLYMLWYVRRLAQKVPEDIILAQIFMMLRTLDAQPLRFSDAAVRARLAVASHRAAVVFERFMPGRTGVQDVAQMKVIDLRMRKAGGKFREYQSWLSLPQHDTRDVLIEELSSVALAVTSGRYHELPEAAIDERDRSKSTAAIRVAKSLAAGLAPLALLWLFDILKISSSGTPWDAIKIFCYVWTSVSVLILLDPLYTAKITSAKEVVGLLGTLTGLLRKGEKP
jgi:hypothetical protein